MLLQYFLNFQFSFPETGGRAVIFFVLFLFLGLSFYSWILQSTPGMFFVFLAVDFCFTNFVFPFEIYETQL